MESERDPPFRVSRMPVGSFERQNYRLSRSSETSDPLRPLGVSIAACFCQRSRFAMPFSIVFNAAPRELGLATADRFLAGLIVVDPLQRSLQILFQTLIDGRAGT